LPPGFIGRSGGFKKPRGAMGPTHAAFGNVVHRRSAAQPTQLAALRAGAMMKSVADIDTGRLVLRPIDLKTARALLEGQMPAELRVAADYPSQFSLEVMDLIAGLRAAEVEQFRSFFLVRKTDATVIGEIGSQLDSATKSVQVGYSIVRSCWGQGYATEALRALLAALLARADVHRITAETMVDHQASRRVMEKAGMRHCGHHRVAEENGATVELVLYELVR
ncbi:MAG TPA: GNAT family protein, partial [Pseudonocardiaceae bacterium]|nr:GNAT family protein [Pseudonocardiaceae bacterium]